MFKKSIYIIIFILHTVSLIIPVKILNASDIEYLEKLTKENPDNIAAYNNLGILNYQQGFLYKSFKNFNSAIKIKPDYINPYYNLAIINLKNNDIASAVDNIETAYNINKNDEKILKLLFYTYTIGNIKKSTNYINDFIKIMHTQDDYNIVCINFLKNGHYKKAESVINAALDKFGDVLSLKYMSGIINWMLGNKKKSISIWTSIIEEYPDYTLVQNTLDRIQVEIEKLEKENTQ